ISWTICSLSPPQAWDIYTLCLPISVVIFVGFVEDRPITYVQFTTDAFHQIISVLPLHDSFDGLDLKGLVDLDCFHGKRFFSDLFKIQIQVFVLCKSEYTRFI